jgi:cellulose biosynthesis protein BcsQ
MRGPMASKVLNQLLLMTDWQAADYLIIDLPPGTGDIQITLSQSISLSGVIVVTTPHQLALLDAAKGVKMFQQVQVPVLGIVENMAYFQIEDGKRYHLFGKGGKDRLMKELLQLQQSSSEDNNSSTNSIVTNSTSNDYFYVQIPLTSELAGVEYDDNSTNQEEHQQPSPPPITLRDSKHNTSQLYFTLVQTMLSQLFRFEATKKAILPLVTIDTNGSGLKIRFFTSDRAEEYVLSGEILYKRHPVSSSSHTSSTSSPTITRIEGKGLYGIGVTFNDGKSCIFTYDMLRELANVVSSSSSSS